MEVHPSWTMGGRIKSLLAISVALLLFLAAGDRPLGAQSTGGSLPGAELNEGQKIQLLISAVERSGGRFYRNGSWHPAAAAAEHMRLKLSRAGGRVETAQDFIRYIATRSSLSGEAYRIRLPDGREFKSADWLNMQLRNL